MTYIAGRLSNEIVSVTELANKRVGAQIMNSHRNALVAYGYGVAAVRNSLDALQHEFWRAICFGWRGAPSAGSLFRRLFVWVLAEAGFLALSLWFALITPKATPEEAVNILPPERFPACRPAQLRTKST
jgi:hypothetical protein